MTMANENAFVLHEDCNYCGAQEKEEQQELLYECSNCGTLYCDSCGEDKGCLFSVKQISPFSSSEFPIVIVGKSPLSAGLVRKHVPLLHPAA